MATTPTSSAAAKTDSVPAAPAAAPLGARSWADLVSHVLHSLESAGIRFHSAGDHYPEPSEPIQWVGVREDGRKRWKFTLRYLMFLDVVEGHTTLGIVDGRSGNADRVREQIRSVYREAIGALRPEVVAETQGTRRYTQVLEADMPQDVIVTLLIFGPASLAASLPVGNQEESFRGQRLRYSVRWVLVDENAEAIPSIRWEQVPGDVRPSLHDLRRVVSDWKHPERRKTTPPTRGDVGQVHRRRFEVLFERETQHRPMWPLFVLMAVNLAVWLLLGSTLDPLGPTPFTEWKKITSCLFSTSLLYAIYVVPFLWFTRDLYRLIGARRFFTLILMTVMGYYGLQRFVDAVRPKVMPVYGADCIVLGLGACLAAVTIRLRDRLPDLVARHWFFLGVVATLPLNGAAMGLAMEGGTYLKRWSLALSLGYFFLLAAIPIVALVLLTLHQLWQHRHGPVPVPVPTRRWAIGLTSAFSMALSAFLVYRYGYSGGEGWLYGAKEPGGQLYQYFIDWELDALHLGAYVPGLLFAMGIGFVYGWQAARRAGDVVPVGWAGERWRGSASVPSTSILRAPVPAPIAARAAAPIAGSGTASKISPPREGGRVERPPSASQGAPIAWVDGGSISGYALEKCLGATILGPVWRGHAADNPGDRVAIKHIPSTADLDLELIHRLPRYFRSDGDTRSRLTKAGITRLREVGDAPPDGLYMISDYVEGISLAHRLTHKIPLSERAVMRIHLAIARVVDAVHEEGIVHRDLRPSNFMLTQVPVGALTRHDAIPEVGYAVLADFGMACRIGREVSQERTSTGGPSAIRFGTPGYIPPEAWTGPWLDRRYDVFALGMSLYFCLCARRFNGEDRPFVEQFEAMLAEGIPEWPDEGYFRRLFFGFERLPAEQAGILRRACSLDRSARQPTAREFAADLENWLESRPIPSVDYTPRQRVYFDVLRAHPLITALGAAGIMFGMVASWGWMDARWKSSQEHAESQERLRAMEQARDKATAERDVEVARMTAARDEQIRAVRAWLDATRTQVQEALQDLREDGSKALAREQWLDLKAGRDPALEVIGLLHAVSAQATRLQEEYGRLCERLSGVLPEEECRNARKELQAFSATVVGLQREWKEAREAISRVSDLLSARHRLASWNDQAIPVRLREARAFVNALGEARREAERKPALATLAAEILKWESRWQAVVQSANGHTGRTLSSGEVTIGGVRGQLVFVLYRWGGDPAQREDLVLRGPAAFWMSTEELTSDGAHSFAEAQRRVFAFASPETLAQTRVQLAGLQQLVTNVTGRAHSEFEIRLPTADEWELAARGVDGRWFPWGNDRPGERDEQRILRGDDEGKDRSPFGIRHLAGRYAEWVLSDAEAREARVAGAGYWDLRLVRAHQFRTFEQEAPGKMGYRIVIVPVADSR